MHKGAPARHTALGPLNISGNGCALVFHIHYQFCQPSGLLRQIRHGLLRFAHGVRSLAGNLSDVVDGMVDLFTGGGLLAAGLGYGVNLIGRGLDSGDNFFQRFAGLVGKIGSQLHLPHGLVHIPHAFCRAVLNGRDGIAHVLG